MKCGRDSNSSTILIFSINCHHLHRYMIIGMYVDENGVECMLEEVLLIAITEAVLLITVYKVF